MTNSIINRVIDEANYMIESKKTVREIATVFNVSKSTVHKDIKDRLYLIDIQKYNLVKKIMYEHIQMRHIKGGESTRQLFLRKRNVTL